MVRGDVTDSATFSGLLLTIICCFKAVLCVCSSSAVLREAGSCFPARMGESKGSIRQAFSLLGMPLPCTWIFNSEDELAW